VEEQHDAAHSSDKPVATGVEEQHDAAEGSQNVPARARRRGKRADPAVRRRLEELREALEACREAHPPAQGAAAHEAWTRTAARVSPLLAELESLEAADKIDDRLLRASRVGMELNRAWWRREAHGHVAQRAGLLVLKWMRRCAPARVPAQ